MAARPPLSLSLPLLLFLLIATQKPLLASQECGEAFNSSSPAGFFEYEETDFPETPYVQQFYRYSPVAAGECAEACRAGGHGLYGFQVAASAPTYDCFCFAAPVDTRARTANPFIRSFVKTCLGGGRAVSERPSSEEREAASSARFFRGTILGWKRDNKRWGAT